MTTTKYILGENVDGKFVYDSATNFVACLSPDGSSNNIELHHSARTVNEAYQHVCAMFGALDGWIDHECEILD